MTKNFKCISVSENTNSFGLHGVILMARDGETWEVAMNGLNKPAKGKVLNVPVDENGRAQMWRMNCEIPSRLTDTPKSVVKSAWGK